MIRKAKEEDFELILEVELESGHPLNKKFKVTKESITEWLGPTFKDNINDFYVFEEEQKMLGFISLKKIFSTHKSCEVNYLAVRESFHKKGIGKKLIRFVEEKANSSGFERIFAYTGEDNLRAQKFYEKIGYLKINEFPGWYSWGDTAFLYGKWLKK
jgi:ribosomal protein S18 acetylase RimI-like enzyme